MKKVWFLVPLYLFPIVYLFVLAGSFHSLLRATLLHYVIFIIFGIFLSFLLVKATKNIKNQETKKIIFVTISGLIILYALFLLLMTMSRFVNFVSEAIDVEYYHFTIWQLANFKTPLIWEGSNIPVWSQHFEPILFFLVPIYWIIKSTTLLMAIQALIVISGAIPIYLSAKEYLKSRFLGLGLAFAYLSFGGLQFGFAYGFHPIMFFPTIFIWAYYFYIRKNLKLYYIFIVLSLFVKEEAAFIVLFWSIYLLIFKRDRQIAIISGVLSIIWYLLCFNIIFPHYNNGNGFVYWGQYNQQEGTGIAGVVKFAFLKPFDFIATLFSPGYKIDMMLATFGSFSFLLFLHPPSLLIIIPSLAEKLLSSGIAGANGTHYSAAITGVTVVATIESIAYIIKSKYLHNIIIDRKRFLGFLIFFLAFSSTVFFGYIGYSPLPSSRNSIYEAGLTNDNENLLLQIIGSIPETASVSAQYQIAPHINKPLDKIKSGPTENEKSDYVIVDTQLHPVLTTGKELNNRLEELNNNKDYEIIINSLGIVVYKSVNYK